MLNTKFQGNQLCCSGETDLFIFKHIWACDLDQIYKLSSPLAGGSWTDGRTAPRTAAMDTFRYSQFVSKYSTILDLVRTVRLNRSLTNAFVKLTLL